jgi:hypothetical protein
MAHAGTAHARRAPTASSSSPRRRDASRLFFKADRPRAIDRYIDYFGGAGAPVLAMEHDRCGEALLERLA